MDEDPAALGRRISDADRPSAPAERRLRFQWNVPLGVTPFVPLWMSVAFLVAASVVVVAAVLR